MSEPDFLTSGSLATLFQAADLVELVGVMNLTKPGISGWLLIHPAGGQRPPVMMDHRGQYLIDPLAASQISKIQVPAESESVENDEPWAKALLGLLGYQFKVEGTDLLAPIWSSGSLLAITGISGVGPNAKSMTQGMVLAVRRIHEIDSLRRDIAGHQFLLGKLPKAVVMAMTTGRILCGTEGGMTIVKELQARTAHPSDAEVLPASLRRAIETGEKHVLLDDLRATITHPSLPACTTAEPLVAVTFSRKVTGSPALKSLTNLTPTERKVYDLLLRGDRNKEIADKLSISHHTARHHVSAILMKTGYPDRVLLIAGAGAAPKQADPRQAPGRINPQPGTLPVVNLPPPKKMIVGKRQTEDAV